MQCFSKRAALHSTSVQSASEEEMDNEAAYLDEVGAGEQSAWCTKVHVNDYSCDFKLDTRAEVTAVAEDLYLQLGKPELKQASKILYGPGQQRLDVLGQFEGVLKYKEASTEQVLFVVRGLTRNLMGLPAVTALKLAARVDRTKDYSTRIREQFPTGLGTLGEPYRIRLKEDANTMPYTQPEECYFH